MKRTLLILLMLFLGGVLTAQDRTSVFVSSRDVYPGEWGDEVIVRNYKNSHVLVHHLKTGSTNNHCFMIKNMTTGVVRGVYTNFGHSLDPDEYRVSCHINDMQILGDTCYFCGQITYSPPPMYDFEGNLIDQSQSYGLLGFFPVTALLLGNVMCHFEKVDGTEELYQLVPVRKSTLCNGYDVLVSAVGRMADDGAACVYEASLSGGIWSGSLMYLDASTDAVFTDIINNNGSLIVSSYLKCGGDEGAYATEPNHYVVVLHEATCNGYTTDYVAPFNPTETAMMYDFSTWPGDKAGDHKRVSVLRQDVGHLDLNNECINTSVSGTAQLGNAYGDKLDCEWHNKYSQERPVWSSEELQVLNINVAQDCEYYTFEF